MVPMLPHLLLDGEAMNQDEAVSRGLGRMYLINAGSIVHDDAAGTAMTPLLMSSEKSMLLEASKVSFFADPQGLVAEFAPSGVVRPLAARLSGTATSAFAPGDETGGQPEPGDASSDEADSDEATADQSDEDEPGDGDAPEVLEGEINLLVIADVDLLSDQTWVDELRIGGNVLGYRKLSDNMNFLLNAMEQMAGSSALISVRARGTATRPFTYVEKIRREAETRYLAQAEALENERRETEQRLRELQRQRPDDGSLILTAEQQAELDRLREKITETNAQLRRVNYNLRKDVENLGLTLKIINTAAAPALVALLAVLLGVYRAARRRADRRSMAGEG